MLVNNLQEDLKKAQLAKDEIKVSTLRMLLSEIHNVEIAKGGSPAGGLSEEDIIQVIQKEVKKRKEAMEAFKSGGRQEQAQKEETELHILESYLPLQLSNEELTEIVDQAITEIGATNIQDLGKVMGNVMSKVVGRADGSTVSGKVKERIAAPAPDGAGSQ